MKTASVRRVVSRSNARRLLSVLAAISSSSFAPLVAQLGAPIAPPLDVEAITGNTKLSGVAFAFGSYWIGGAPGMGTESRIYEVDPFAGTLVTESDPCPNPPKETEDFTWTEDGRLIGIKDGIICDYVKSDTSKTGLDCICSPLYIPSEPNAVAYDPATRTYYVASETSAIEVFTAGTSPCSTLNAAGSLPSTGKNVHGLAWDPVRNVLWAACANNPQGGNVNLVEFNALDPTTGALIPGLSFMGLTNLPPPNIVRGCETYHDVRNPGKLSLVAIHRSNPDVLVVYDLDVPFACTGYPLPYCTGKTNSLGCVPDIDFTGTPSANAGSGFVVRATDALNNKSGLLFYSLSGRDLTSFSGGLKCVAAPVIRTPPRTSGGTPPPANDCSGVFSIDMNAFAAGALGGSPDPALTLPGTMVHCQWWSRDPQSPPSNASLSNALEYSVCP